MIFYAEPKDEEQKPKSEPDKESEYAVWMGLEEFAGLKHIRGPELLEFGKYVEEGGLLTPLSVYCHEGDRMASPSETAKSAMSLL